MRRKRRKRRWRRFLKFWRAPGITPRERGVLEAHRMAPVRTVQLREILARATRRRRGLLARLLPSKRKYLDGLISGLEGELKRRGREV